MDEGIHLPAHLQVFLVEQETAHFQYSGTGKPVSQLLDSRMNILNGVILRDGGN
jgi:hypothetical protein